jgi:hypothetical protein
MEDSKEMRINYGSTYVEYKGYRIFYDYKPTHKTQWLITIHRGEPKPGVPTLGTYWFDDRDKGIQWAKDVIDTRLKLSSNLDSSVGTFFNFTWTQADFDIVEVDR